MDNIVRSPYIQSVRKAISILMCFNPEELELGGSEIARKIGVHRTTTHRILSTLVEDKILEKNPRTNRYSIGPHTYAIGNLYLSSTDLPKATEPVMDMLNMLTDEAISIGIRDGGNIIHVMRKEANYPLRIDRHIGSVVSAHASSMGKALLSELSNEEIDNLFEQNIMKPVTDNTITGMEALKKELSYVKKEKVAHNKEESVIGLEAVASIIRNNQGTGIAALSINIPVVRSNNKLMSKLALLVKAGAELISYRLGYTELGRQIADINTLESIWNEDRM
jgi:DNA-binding IclR family transcriptional regulator